MPFLAMFALVALAEMMTFFWVGSKIGLGWALGLALATALIGSYLVRRAGIAVWRRFRNKMGQGALPGRELTHGGAILVAGAFLISPGFLTDVAGFLLLVPGIRDLIHRFITKRLSNRVTVFTAGQRVAGDWAERRRPPDTGNEDIIDVDGWE